MCDSCCDEVLRQMNLEVEIAEDGLAGMPNGREVASRGKPST